VTGLAESYRYCKKLNRRYGTTYYWSTYLLPRRQRPHIHAVYGFCRYADDIVDDLASTMGPDERRRALADFGDRFFADLAAGSSEHPVLRAVIDTVQTYRIDPACFRRFLHSMDMDFTTATYETFDDLMEYMDGSAAVIGEMVLPIIAPDPTAELVQRANDLGVAFQLSNFLRDAGEDLARDRVYIPQEDIRRFGADPRDRKVTPAWVDLMKFEIERTRRIYASADAGIPMLPGRSARCIRGARVLYSAILDRIEAAGYDVFTQRVRVPTWQKLAVALGVWRP
jgi:phytoene synthase